MKKATSQQCSVLAMVRQSAAKFMSDQSNLHLYDLLFDLRLAEAYFRTIEVQRSVAAERAAKRAGLVG